MSYNLKDHINEWVNIELSIDNTNNQAEIFINGSKKDTITYEKKLTKNSQSKLHFGSRADRSKGFRGKLESINISNSKTNETISSAKLSIDKCGWNGGWVQDCFGRLSLYFLIYSISILVSANVKIATK